VDYDNNKTAADIQPIIINKLGSLKSFCQEVNLLTNLYYSANYKDKNLSVEQFKNEISSTYGIDICADPFTNERNAKTLFGAYNFAINDGNLTTLDAMRSDFIQVDTFFNDHLSTLS